MPFTIQPVTFGDVSALASVMTSSRWVDPHWNALFEPPTTEEQVTWELAQRLPWNLISGGELKRHQKAVDVETGKVVGYARWILPPTLEEEAWKEAQAPEANLDQRQLFEKNYISVTDSGRVRHIRRDLSTYRSGILQAVDDKFMADGPFLTLDYLSTAPAYQRKGIGAELLKSGLDVADANGLRTIVTAQPAGVKLYLNHGFDLMQTVSIDYSQYGGTENKEDHFMIRQPVMDH